MKVVNVAIVGCGGFAGVHARRLAQIPECRVVALHDISPERTAAFLERHFAEAEQRPEPFDDMQAMLVSGRVEAVVICTPHTLHYEHGAVALENGCHVLMEKPMVTESGQAVALAGLAERSGKVFTIGYNTPCTPAFEHLRKLVRDQSLGRLRVVTGWLSQDWKKLTAGTWRQEPSLSGGGQMYDSGAHLFNSLVWAVEQPVEEVFAMADNRDAPVDIDGVAAIRFANGVLATIAIAGDCANEGAGMAFAFEDGLVEVDGWGGSWLKVSRRGDGCVFSIPDAVEDGLVIASRTNPDKNFIDSILRRDEPRTTPVHGVLQSILMDAIYESARTGAPVMPPSFAGTTATSESPAK